MKIFVDGLIFARQEWGGISRMWAEYLKRLPQHVSEIKLLVPFHHHNHWLKEILKSKKDFEVVKDYFYWPIRYFERIPIKSRILHTLYVDESVDIFHSTFFSTIYKKNIKKVITVHDMVLEIFQNEFTNKWNNLEIEKKKEAIKNSDKIIAVSNSTKKDLLKIYPWVSEKKIKVIYHGLFPNIINRVSFDEIVQNYHLTIEPERYFLYVGRRKRQKNFQILVSLLENRTKYKNFPFLCVGGEEHDPIQKSLTDKRLKNNFVFLDHVTDGELVTLYQNARALIFTSRYEGFGFPVLEAMINGCPVICTDASALPEIAGDAAFYFDPDSVESLDNALEQLSKADRKEVTKKGKNNTIRFSWDRSIQKLINLYEEIL